ncbi:MAG: hypothetical protein M9938_03925 [Solirubrobacterales bacterium]|nr:hypothetical protein [Solirubrobacterales bacterium]
MFEEELDGELISEEDVVSVEGDEVRALPREYESRRPLPAIREDVATAAIAVAGGALAGVATVAAVRAVSGSGASRRRRRRLSRRARPGNVVASRSFLVDVHLLGD